MFRTMYRWLRAVLFILFSCLIGHSFLENALFKSYPFHTVTPSEFIRVLSVRGVTDCGCSCMRSQRCVSFNFALEANAEGKYVCQLLPTDQAHHGLTTTPFFHHYELVPTNNCRKNKCPPLMECHSGYKPQGYRCIYPDKCYKVPDERVLYFPRKSVDDYIKLTTSFNTSLTAFTFSLMVQIESSYSQHTSAAFSLATPAAMDTLLIFIRSDKVFFYVHDQLREIKIALDDGKWHHICTTWESTSGNWQVYIDGHIRDEGTGLAKGESIKNGIAIIGQDQDGSMGGGFDQSQSFGEGRITSMSLWDKVLSPHDGSLSFLANFECHPQPGKVLSWEDMLTGERHGNVTVQG